jgi:hypothetical protein
MGTGKNSGETGMGLNRPFDVIEGNPLAVDFKNKFIRHAPCSVRKED